MWCRVCFSNPGDAGSLRSLHDRNYPVEVRHALRLIYGLGVAKPELLTALSLHLTGPSFE